MAYLVNKINNNKTVKYCLLLITLLLSSGCTTLNGPANPDDPYESYNRSMFAFNENIDKYALKPMAEGYNFVMPNIASKGVSNFFNNIDDIVVFFNQLLQFKLRDAAATSARFVFNTSFGLLGLIDVASDMDLPKANEDFGQTLAVWGFHSGPYIVLPFFGPSNIRDTVGLVTDWIYYDPIAERQTENQNIAFITLKYVDIRAGLLKASNILDGTVGDKYSYIRDAWFQRRQFLIYDGHPPQEFTDEQLFGDDNLFKEDDLFKDENLLDKNKTDAPPGNNAIEK